MNRLPKIVLFLYMVLSVAGCASVSNAPVAECRKQPDGYVLSMRGIRNNMTHSVVMFLLKPTQEAKLELLVPRITGTVQGNEVVRQDDPSEQFSGSLDFSAGAVEVSLLFGSVRPQIPLDWNGRYQLSQCK